MKRSAILASLILSLSAAFLTPGNITPRGGVRSVEAAGPPNAPILNSPANGATQVSTWPTLNVTVSDPDSDRLTVTFFGRPRPATVGPDFTLVVLPDTQNYTSGISGGSPSTFISQTQWIVDNRASRNIVYVTHTGDIVNDGDWDLDWVKSEWLNAKSAMYLLDDVVPYGLAIGNCDNSANPNSTMPNYNNYFGIDHFYGRGYYGGQYGTDNHNHYELFSASGLDFIVVTFEYMASLDPAVLDWADNLLKTYATRRAIVVNHDTLDMETQGSFSAQGQAIYDALKNNSNLFLMLSGHTPGEGQRQDTFSGRTVYSLRADYQSRANGGDGWLRILKFSPANNQIQVQTYSPTLNQYETDADSQFTLTYDMGGSDWQVIGTNTNVPSSSATSMSWPNLNAQTLHEWYVTVNDGVVTTTGPTWTFTTSPVCSATGAISSGFNGTSISGSNWIWFNSNFTISGLDKKKTTVITFASNITLNSSSLQVPTAKIIFEKDYTGCSVTTYQNGMWVTRIPMSDSKSDEIFLAGLAYQLSQQLPGGANVSWQGTFTSDQPGVSLSWKWGAAVYTNMPTDLNAIAPKATHKTCAYSNSDHAGTPEGFIGSTPLKKYVIGGARGGGGSNYTGSWSGTKSVNFVCR